MKKIIMGLLLAVGLTVPEVGADRGTITVMIEGLACPLIINDRSNVLLFQDGQIINANNFSSFTNFINKAIAAIRFSIYNSSVTYNTDTNTLTIFFLSPWYLYTNIGGSGILTTSGGYSVNDMYVHSGYDSLSGKFVVVGAVSSNAYIARYNANGSLDTTFGVQGICTVPGKFNGVTYDSANSRYICVGTVTISDGFVVAVNASTGASSTLFNGGAVIGQIKSVVLQGSNIVFASQNFGSTTLAIGRLTSSGQLDTTFGGAGYYNQITFTNPVGAGRCLSRVGDGGSIVVVGNNVGTTMQVIRLTQNGTLDTTFATGFAGNMFTTVGTANAVALTQDGGYIVVGKDTSGITKFKVVKLTSAGALDTSFNTTGIQTSVLGVAGNCEAFAVIQSNVAPYSYIIAGDARTSAPVSQFGVLMLNQNGSLATTAGAGYDAFVASATDASGYTTSILGKTSAIAYALGNCPVSGSTGSFFVAGSYNAGAGIGVNKYIKSLS